MADDEQFSLCWNNFNSNLSAGFHESLLRGDLVDVTLAAEGQLVKAHRLILSVCSPYFRKMFTQVPVNQHAFIFLKDVSHSALKDLIQFMYCGEVNVKQDALPAFISTAEALQIKGLTESGDSVPANQSPAKEEITAAVPVTASVPTPTAPAPRVKVQRNRVQSFKVDSEAESGDDKVQIRAQQHLAQATVVASTQKRVLQQRAQQVSKRTKLSVSASSEGLDTSDTAPTQVQTVQIVKQIPAQTIEPEYIELPIESINPKNEPDYTDEPTEIETVDAETEQEQEHKLSEHDQGEVDDDGNYVEDEAYGEMTITKYDETYLTEGEDNVKPGVSGFGDSYTSDGGTGTEQSAQGRLLTPRGQTKNSLAAKHKRHVNKNPRRRREQKPGLFASNSSPSAPAPVRVKLEKSPDSEPSSLFRKNNTPVTVDESRISYISGRGNNVLIYDGHRYIKNNLASGRMYWKCSKWHTNCKARAITLVSNPNHCVLKNSHNHDADELPVEEDSKNWR